MIIDTFEEYKRVLLNYNWFVFLGLRFEIFGFVAKK
jgi:hypothetical protein